MKKSENQEDGNYNSAKNISFREVDTKIKPNYDPNSRSSSKPNCKYSVRW